MGHGHKYEHECAYHRVVDFSVQANCLCVGSARRSGDALHDNKFHTLYVAIYLYSLLRIRRKYSVSITPYVHLVHSRHQY